MLLLCILQKKSFLKCRAVVRSCKNFLLRAAVAGPPSCKRSRRESCTGGNSVIAPVILILGSRGTWVVNHAPADLPPRKNSGVHWVWGGMSPTAGLDFVTYCADIQVAAKVSPPPAVPVGLQLCFSTFVYLYRLKLVPLHRRFLLLLLLLSQEFFLLQTVSSFGHTSVSAY
jgi:hypothetical protein